MTIIETDYGRWKTRKCQVQSEQNIDIPKGMEIKQCPTRHANGLRDKHKTIRAAQHTSPRKVPTSDK
jgi:hypothetical protein